MSIDQVKRRLPVATPERQLIGSLVGIDDSKRPLVDFPGNRGVNPVPALTLAVLPAIAQAGVCFPVPVLLNLVGEEYQPVIVGLLHEQLFASPANTMQHKTMPANDVTQTLKADIVSIEGNEEIQFSCGKSSLSLKKNGQIVIKGENITNRARRANKIKGGSVQVN